MLIQQGQHMATAAAGMGPVNALQHLQDSTILGLSPATSREPLQRSMDQARHAGARADFLLAPDGKETGLQRLQMLKTGLENEATSSKDPRSEATAKFQQRTINPELRSRNSKNGSDLETLGVKAVGNAFVAQRLELSAQPSSSKDPRLTALNNLELRGFKPAPGGLEIPLTGKAMGGMYRRRINAPFTPEAESTTEGEYMIEIDSLRTQVLAKRNIIAELRMEIEQGNLSQEQVRINRQTIENTLQEISALQNRLCRAAERARQAARSR